MTHGGGRVAQISYTDTKSGIHTDRPTLPTRVCARKKEEEEYIQESISLIRRVGYVDRYCIDRWGDWVYGGDCLCGDYSGEGVKSGMVYWISGSQCRLGDLVVCEG